MTHLFTTVIFIFLLFVSFLSGQEPLKIGQWQSHLPFQGGRSVTQSDEKIFYATEWAIVTFDKADRSPEFYTKINKLNDVGIERIKYHKELDILIVAYSNSNIDMITPEGTIALPFIKNAINILGDKTIYGISFDGNDCFFSTGFGIVKLNLERAEFEYTTFTSIAIRDLQLWEGDYYAATDEGIYRADRNNFNLADFGNWELLDIADGFPATYSTTTFAVFNNDLYFDIDTVLYMYTPSGLDSVYTEKGHSVQFLSAESEHLIIGMRCRGGCNGKGYRMDSNGNMKQFSGNCVSRPQAAIEDQQGRVWFADGFDFYRVNNNIDNSCETFGLNSPFRVFVWGIEIFENEVWVSTGGIGSAESFRNLGEGFYSYIDGDWEFYIPSQVPEMSGLKDFLSIAIHPDNRTVYASSYLDGLVEYDRENFIVYDDSNSTLEFSGNDPSRTKVSGIAFDDENNLWMCNHNSPKPVAVLKNDGTWKSFDISVSENFFREVMVDANGYKWFSNISNNPLIILDTGADIDDETDDRIRFLNSGNSELPTNTVRSMATDLNGDVWVGTSEGAVVFECGANVFDQACRGNRRIVEQDGFNAYLLETESVNTIAVDGANRKWFGTNNGIFVQSPNGEEQIITFNTDNSPLFSNVIVDIAINPINGEVWIGTDEGLMSYKSDAVAGKNFNTANIIVYPNPVRENYEGPIAIKGLARDADVKITDANGRLVYTTKALGGQAIWDGYDYTGRRANTGVYLVFSTSNNTFDPDAAVAKILVIN